MATKVEEERELLVKAIGCYDVFGDHKVSLGMNGMIDSLIAAARAEGAEAERERIRKAADHYQAEDECFAAQLVDLPSRARAEGGRRMSAPCCTLSWTVVSCADCPLTWCSQRRT